MSFDESYFATHFQNESKEESFCMSSWDNDNFLDDSFWSQNPTDTNIVCALYGANSQDQTAYTTTWLG